MNHSPKRANSANYQLKNLMMSVPVLYLLIILSFSTIRFWRILCCFALFLIYLCKSFCVLFRHSYFIVKHTGYFVLEMKNQRYERPENRGLLLCSFCLTLKRSIAEDWNFYFFTCHFDFNQIFFFSVLHCGC